MLPWKLLYPMSRPISNVRLSRTLLTLGLLVAYVNAWAQEQVAPTTSSQARALRAHVEYLADDLLEGRGTGSRGYALAAAYVATQMKIVGLKAAGENGHFLQSVPFVEATPVLPGSSAKWTHDNESVVFEDGRDYSPGADFTVSKATLTAPLAFAGFGISAPELDYDDLNNVDIRDHFAVILSGAPKRFPEDARAYLSSDHYKLTNLVKHGAVGVIEIDLPSDTDKTWDQKIAEGWQPQMRWIDSDGQPIDAFPELKQRFRFNSNAGTKFFTGENNFQQVLDTADASKPQGFILAGSLTLTTTTGLRHTESNNVLGVLEGSDPALKREYVVVTAHLDQFGRGVAVDGDAIYNGAHDNAMGVAMMLEIARTLASAEHPKRSILFVAVTAKEQSLLGSDYFVAHAVSNRQRLIANLDIDTPMPFAASQDIQIIGALKSSIATMVKRVAQENGFNAKLLNEDSDSLACSDRMSFLKHGIPAFTLVNGTRARDGRINLRELQQTFLRQHRQQPSDESSLPFDYDAAAALTRTQVAIILDIANAPTPPYLFRSHFFANHAAP
jgi:Peptidase family M28